MRQKQSGNKVFESPCFSQTLTGEWKLAIDPENLGRKEAWYGAVRSESRETPVPSIIQQVYPTYHGVAWYWHTFSMLRQVEPGHRAVLRFGAVDYLGEVWVNGAYVGGYEGGETPFELDVTAAVRIDIPNLLAVRVLNPTDDPIDGYVLEETPHRHKTEPFIGGRAFNSGGIMYPVELAVVPALRVVDMFVRPHAATGRMDLTVTIRNDESQAVMTALTVEVSPASSGDVIQTTGRQVDCPVGSSEHELAVTVVQPRLWNLDDPFLYRITATLQTGEGQASSYSVRSGFRDFRIVEGYFQLNGRRLFLKSTHTGNMMPIGQQLPAIPDHVRRDLIYAKASGFNMVRFIAGVAYPEQLDFCDELGLMVYEECFAAWCLADSPKMGERFDRSTSDMIRRDRNHPCITIWGMMNETGDGPVYRRAVDFLPKLRKLDDTRLVLLNSGRLNCPPSIGSASNPGGDQWEYIWGSDDPDAQASSDHCGLKHGGYMQGVGDAHVYPATPHSPQTIAFMRNLGHELKPVFLSEYGIGSMMDVISEGRHFTQAGARPDLKDAAILQAQSEALCADWKRLGFEGVYPFPVDLLRESQRLHARQRTLGFNIIRSNPRLCGYNLTGMLDHGITGEGLWTYWRQWKPSTFDAVSDGWSSLRWCLFVDPQHGYCGRTVEVEAVLATEDVLGPGEYPARFCLFGPDGVQWTKTASVHIPPPGTDGYGSLAVPVLREQIRLDGPPGSYTFAADMEGAAPTGGRLLFYGTDSGDLPSLEGKATLWGIDRTTEDWLISHGLECRQIEWNRSDARELILVGPSDATDAPSRWQDLTRRMEGGSTVLFLDPQVFQRGEDPVYWLPLKNKGKAYEFDDWLYHKECVANRHPVFDGLQDPGIMDWDYYGPVIPHYVFEEQDTPDETIVAAFAAGQYTYPDCYGSSLLTALYRLGAGRFILNTLCILQNLNTHPAADRLLINLIRYAGRSI